MQARHGVSVEAANEALADPRAAVADPDYASQSGRSVRTIGWSTSARRLLTIITVAEDEVTYGINGCRPTTSTPDATRQESNHE